jgi:hypothetical protein
VRAYASQNTEDRLNKKGRFDQALVHKMRQVVKVANVVALKLKTRLVGVAGLQRKLNVFEESGHGCFLNVRVPSRVSNR